MEAGGVVRVVVVREEGALSMGGEKGVVCLHKQIILEWKPRHKGCVTDCH